MPVRRALGDRFRSIPGPAKRVGWNLFVYPAVEAGGERADHVRLASSQQGYTLGPAGSDIHQD